MRQTVATSDGAAQKIIGFVARFSLQRGEVPVFSQLQYLLALDDFTVTGPILRFGHSLNLPHQKCRYSVNREPSSSSGFWAMREPYQAVSRLANNKQSAETLSIFAPMRTRRARFA
jgi:hypothetical protein